MNELDKFADEELEMNKSRKEWNESLSKLKPLSKNHQKTTLDEKLIMFILGAIVAMTLYLAFKLDMLIKVW